jgi:hypothetical protein
MVDAKKVLEAVGDEPERACAKGPEAVRHVVTGWATRALAAEEELAHFHRLQEVCGGPLPENLGLRESPGGGWTSAYGRAVALVVDAAKARGIEVVESPYTSEEVLERLLRRIAGR